MVWKVFVWVLLVSWPALARRQDDRFKRFMLNTGANSTGQAGNGNVRKVHVWDKYKDWNPVDEYPFPAPRKPQVRTPPLPLRTNGGYLKSLMTERRERRRRPAPAPSARSDRLLLDGEVVAREHAKLVNDINGLSEARPGWALRDENGHREETKDEFSIYMENLQPGGPAQAVAAPAAPAAPAAATTARPPAVNLKIVPAAVAGVKAPLALPIIVLGGDKNTPKLTTMKHPYPFVGAASTARPARLRPLLPFAYPMRAVTPTLWQRFVSLFPRLIR